MGALEGLGQAIKDFIAGRITEEEFNKKIAQAEASHRKLKEIIEKLGREVEKKEENKKD